ncbi:MAG: tetraacyldisaccharide 4'-kinase [Rhodoferax sp.]
MNTATPTAALQRLLAQAWTRRGLLACVLWPLGQLYGALAALRRGLFRLGVLRTGQVPVPVIVVGNVVAGGSGKTPVVIALVQHLQQRGLRAGVISRGYGRHNTDCREVHADSPISDVGDEPALIKRSTAASVFVATRRLDAARALLERHPDTQVIVCDDGLQHLALRRDLEICVFDDRGVGNGFLLPAGPLRERWPRSADLVLHTGALPSFGGFTAKRALDLSARCSDGSRIPLADLTRPDCRPLMAVAAIAKPEEFFAMLRAAGLQLSRTARLPDHSDFSDWSSRDSRNFTVLCTEKDAVKLWQIEPGALAVPLLCTPEPAFIARFDALLDGLLRSRSKSTLSSRHGHKTS